MPARKRRGDPRLWPNPRSKIRNSRVVLADIGIIYNPAMSGKREDVPASARKRCEELRAEIDRHSYLYYVEAAPEISDIAFDALMRELQDLEARYPSLATPDSPTRRVGGAPLPGFETVEHEVPMLSIDNTYAEDEIREFDERVRKGLGVRKSRPTSSS